MERKTERSVSNREGRVDMAAVGSKNRVDKAPIQKALIQRRLATPYPPYY